MPKNAAEIKDWFVRFTDFDANGGKGETIELKIMSKENLARFLSDDEWREKVRVKLPSLIGKIQIKDHKFFVLNRRGKLVSESSAYESLRNKSDRWKTSLKKAAPAKTTKEKVIDYLSKQ